MEKDNQRITGGRCSVIGWQPGKRVGRIPSGSGGKLVDPLAPDQGLRRGGGKQGSKEEQQECSSSGFHRIGWIWFGLLDLDKRKCLSLNGCNTTNSENNISVRL
jgi:hypothetical protein